jgi:hypothetical protein
MTVSVVVLIGLVALLLFPVSAIPRSTLRAPLPLAAPHPSVLVGPASTLTATPGPSTGPDPMAVNAPRTADDPSPHTVHDLRPHPAIIDPLSYYTREPAPMGISDFGVTGTGAGASAYAYSSPSFQGQATVRSLSVSISGSSSKVTAFELNAVIVLQRDGTNYTYWIQNGLHVDAGSDEFTIGGAYVWNFSSPTATLGPGDVQGAAGSTGGEPYYYIPGCGPSYAGQCSTLSLPATLAGRILSATSAGIPYVAYEYDLGAGWVTYDNVSFPHMANASDPGFRVDGFSPTPRSTGAFYNAEWVWVGAGGGALSTDKESDIDLSLDRWNGHNYQAIPTAWDFGSNTGETSTNVTESVTTAHAAPAAHLASGPGTLGVLYNQTQVGFLNLTVPVSVPATVVVDGNTVPFQGGWANLTLPTGSHSLYLENYTNASAPFSVVAGATTSVNLSGAGEVTFIESGLPAGTSWGITVNGTSLTTTGKSVAVHLVNGTYPVSYARVPGYYRLGVSPATLALPGTSEIALAFALFTYEVTFTESGLPASTPWWVNASGVQVPSTGTTLEVAAPNGSTPYTTGSRYEFLATPAVGTIVVSAGVAPSMTVGFSYRPTFIAGTVSPADAVVSIGGFAQSLTGGSYNDSVIPGTYDLVASASGYATDRLSVTATPGNVTWENLTLELNQTQPPPSTSTTSDGGGISLVTAAVVIAGVAAVAILAIIVVARRRR